MLILGLDTATPWGSVALCENEEILCEVSLRAGKGGGEYLLSLLNTLVHTTGRKLSEIELIAVGTGPGSYTGIRVGLAAVKGLAQGLQIPVAGISTLEIMAANTGFISQWVASVIDARRGEVYAAIYQMIASSFTIVLEPQIILVNELADRLGALPAVIICGDGSKNYQPIWAPHSNIQIAPKHWDRPLGSWAAILAYQKKDLHPDPTVNLLKPSYLRRVEAEIRLEEKLHASQNATDASRGSGGSTGN